MGETEDAMHYDEEQIFKHLSVTLSTTRRISGLNLIRCFYLDTFDNAAKNKLAVKPQKHEKDIKKK